MDVSKLSAIIAILVALSVASERLVEIVKNLIPWLNQQLDDPMREGWRRAALQILAVGAGIVTALLARPAMEGVAPEGWTEWPGVLALGLLASGGSGFWNSVQTYVSKAKDLKKFEAMEKKLELPNVKPRPPAAAPGGAV
jgi:drug/metabolite transporter (DMT)-like permease